MVIERSLKHFIKNRWFAVKSSIDYYGFFFRLLFINLTFLSEICIFKNEATMKKKVMMHIQNQ